MMQESAFVEKFMKKLGKIDSAQIESFLGQIIREKVFLGVILDSIPEGVIVIDQSGRVAYSNDVGRQFLLPGTPKAASQHLVNLLKEEAMRLIAEEFFEEREPIQSREVYIGSPVERVYTVSIVPIENELDVATHSVWIIGDRTEVHRLIEEKQRMGHLESLATLTAGVAHEIKNPLNSLHIHGQLIHRNSSRLLEGDQDRAAVERILASSEVILEEIQRLARIVDTFTGAVRPVRPMLRKVDLRSVIDPVIELLGPECEERGITLRLRQDPEIPPLLLDPEQIQQAILNLLKNAVEAIDKPEGLIEITTHLGSDHARIEIHDNGMGIPESVRSRIFEPHFTTKFTGTGLGLMVVLRIIRAHGGGVIFKTNEGVGTRVILALPLNERPIRMLAGETHDRAVEATKEELDPVFPEEIGRNEES